MKTIPVLVAKQERKLARNFYLVGILGKRRVKNLCTNDMFYGGSVRNMKLVARIMMKKLKIRKSIIDCG